ncbi:3-mercaptopyruvate sulfurtransferase-like [Convolutriloba macropyga]|uniref:3-mercaptopyruvate sulfurtransferase-like n=1 Tax=Convolutriloba macropyga TaxID=536237 RepID=UPI003F5230A3
MPAVLTCLAQTRSAITVSASACRPPLSAAVSKLSFHVLNGSPATSTSRKHHRATPKSSARLIPQFAPRDLSARRQSSVVQASAMSSTPSLVSASWLKENLRKPGLKVLDGTWYMPGSPNDPVEEFKADRIPGASMFLSDAIADKSSGLPHMLPSPEVFASAVGAMGITNDTHVVVYDRHGVFSAPRVWWTFRVMGHDAVSVLEGGLPAWKAADGELETSPIPEEDFAKLGIDPMLSADGPSPYVATSSADKVRALQQMWDNIEKKSDQVVDARSSGRFYGTAPEPRAGMRGGHIPGSRSVPFDEVLLEGKSGLKSPDKIKEIFSGAGIDLNSGAPIVASCGSGMTACILALALDQIDQPLTAIYDGSWMEWGTNQDVPVVTED